MHQIHLFIKPIQGPVIVIKSVDHYPTYYDPSPNVKRETDLC